MTATWSVGLGNEERIAFGQVGQPRPTKGHLLKEMATNWCAVLGIAAGLGEWVGQP